MESDPAALERDRWDSSAKEYPALSRSVSYFRESATRIVCLVSPSAGSIIVDVGCGSSGLVQDAILKYPPGFSRLYCVDVSARMLEVLSEAYDDPRMRFIRGKAESLSEVIPTRVDTIFVNSAIWLFDVAASLEQFRKTLSREGRLAFTIAEWDLNEQNLPSCRSRRYELIDAELRDRRLPPKPNRGSTAKYSVSEIVEALEISGFEVETVQSHLSTMQVADWVSFYSISAIARRSLPGLSVDTAVQVLTGAMRRFGECREVDTLAWKLVRARRI